VISLDPEHYDRVQRTVAAAFRLAHEADWQAHVDAAAPPHLRFVPGNFGVFMGYDFHVTPAGPRLIEINTNAGGALVNGLHTATLCDPAKLACLCTDLLPVEAIEERLVGQFLAELAPDAVWAERRRWVFKPATAFGSRAVYRGDKISRKRFGEILAVPCYLAQRHVEPGTIEVETSEGRQTMKFDVRAYAYRDEVLLLGARVYQGQVTNLRSPGGGFSAICVAAGADAGAGTCLAT
jgi:hypothetical protein